MTVTATILPLPNFLKIEGADPSFPDLSTIAARRMRRIADEVELAPGHAEYHEWEIALSELSLPTAFQMMGQISIALKGRPQSVYAFHLVDGPDPETVLADLAHAKALQDGRKYPRLGKLEHCRASKTLYVGSSHKTPKRLAEHLGKCAKSTYGLRLAEWATHWPGKVRIEVRIFDGIEPHILQILEDHLAYELKPIVGKRGGK